MEATQLVNTYLNVKEMSNNRKINDILTKEHPKSKHNGRDEPKILGRKRSHKDHRDKKDKG